jgi:hypothetical protein
MAKADSKATSFDINGFTYVAYEDAIRARMQRDQRRRERDLGRPDLELTDNEAPKSYYTRPSQLTSKWTSELSSALQALTDQHSRVETESGRVFSISADALATIQELSDELVDAVRCAQVITREPRALSVDGKQLSAARSDRAFRRFLDKSGLSTATK